MTNVNQFQSAKLVLFGRIQVVENYFRNKPINLLTLHYKILLKLMFQKDFSSSTYNVWNF